MLKIIKSIQDLDNYLQVMDFILAHSRYRRQKFDKAIQICDGLLQKNAQDEAAWMLKCLCLVQDNYLDELQTEEQALSDLLTENNEANTLARAGTSFKNPSSRANPIMRPLKSGRINTGFQRVGTRMESRAASKGKNMLRTGRIMTKGGVPTTSNGRVLRLATASLQQHGQNFFDASKVDLRKIAQRKSKARSIFLYLFHVEHNLKKALELAILATQMNNYDDPWWKLALGKCYYHLCFYPEAEKQLLSSIKHNNNIQSFLYLSRIYQKQDNVEKSLQVLENGKESHRYEPKLLIWMGRIYDKLHLMDKSHEYYKDTISIENCNIQAVANIASYHFYKDMPEISLKLYQRLIELGYDSPEIWNNLALCCFANNQYDVFYNCFERALGQGREDPILFSDLWYNIGHVYCTLGELAMAAEAYMISLACLPDNIEALNNLAVIQCERGNIESGINLAEKSFREQANFEAAYNLSIWYYQKFQFQKAYHYNKEALILYPNHTESKQLLKRLNLKLDNL